MNGVREVVRSLSDRAHCWAVRRGPNRVEATVWINGERYALGFVLSGDPLSNRRGLRVLTNAIAETISRGVEVAERRWHGDEQLGAYS